MKEYLIAYFDNFEKAVTRIVCFGSNMNEAISEFNKAKVCCYILAITELDDSVNSNCL